MHATVLILAFLFPSPSEEERTKCGKLIENLSHARYAVREMAARDLAKLGTMAKPSLLAAIRTSRDPETVRRCRLIVKEIARSEADSLNPMPEIDAAWYDVDRKMYAYTDRFKPMIDHLYAIGTDSYPWQNYRWATWFWVESWLAKGVSPMPLRAILAAMHAKDEVFFRNYSLLTDEQRAASIVDWREYLKGK